MASVDGVGRRRCCLLSHCCSSRRWGSAVPKRRADVRPCSRDRDVGSRRNTCGWSFQPRRLKGGPAQPRSSRSRSRSRRTRRRPARPRAPAGSETCSRSLSVTKYPRIEPPARGDRRRDRALEERHDLGLLGGRLELHDGRGDEALGRPLAGSSTNAESRSRRPQQEHVVGVDHRRVRRLACAFQTGPP